MTEKRLRVGVLGLRRGMVFVNLMAAHLNARLAALCDRDGERLQQVAEGFQEDPPQLFEDFDDMLRGGLDAVVIANDATAHVPLAVAALRAGVHVLSEVPACATMAEAVQLVEAAEQTSAVYMMGENCCFSPSAAEMRRRYHAGDIGEFQHGEGEYVHDTEHVWARLTGGRKGHWRNWRFSTFYCTHSLGPVMHITDTRVRRVVAMETPNRVGYHYGRLHGDSAVVLCQMSNDATVKSLISHGGLRRAPASHWLCLYGTEGMMETSRWDLSNLTVYVGGPEPRTDYAPSSVAIYGLERYQDLADRFAKAHGGMDFVTTHFFLEAALGRREPRIDVYRATDMSMPGLLGYRSILEGNVPYEVPDLRDPSQRARWRDDHWTVDPSSQVAGGPASSSSFPVPEIPDDVYEHQRELVRPGVQAANSSNASL